MEKMMLAWHNHHCSKHEQIKTDKNHSSKSERKLMPPQKDNWNQQ